MIAVHPRAIAGSRARWLAALLLGPSCANDAIQIGSASDSSTGTSDPHDFPPTGAVPTTSTSGDTSTATTSSAAATGGQGGSGGDADATTASTAEPTPDPVCGDGVLDPSEECEPIEQGKDDCGCNAQTCRPPECGNGVQEPCEECDLGPMNGVDQYDGCTAGTCKRMAHCGDQIVDAPDELCDEGESGGLDDEANIPCSGNCTWVGRAVFVTRAKFSGDLGGIVGADGKCRDAAKAAGRPDFAGYRAWLSDGASSPLQTFQLQNTKGAPYYRLGKVKGLAADFASLVGGGPAYPIDHDEFGVAITDGEVRVWTNTTAAGQVASNAAHCNNWSSADGSWKGRVGLLNESGPAWTEGFNTLWDCNFARRLYCFQDAP